MNKYLVIILIFLFLSFKIKEKNAPNIVKLVNKEYSTKIKNGTILLIYNGICRGGLCGSKLNKYLLNNIPTNTSDSIYFLLVNYEKDLIDTLNLYQKSRILYTNSNTLNRYSIYEQESTAVRIKKNKITHSTKIYQGINFNKWIF